MRIPEEKAKPPVEPAPRLYPDGATVAILGSGPSLTQADVDLLRGRVDGVVAVNDSYRLCPWATVLYAGDRHWWKWHKGAPGFAGRKFSISSTVYPDVQVLKRGPETGLSMSPDTLALGRNSVYQAMNLAVHFGATSIILLGVDLQGTHFFGLHPDGSKPPFDLCRQRFATLVQPLAQLGIEVVNCSRVTTLRCFARRTLEDVLDVTYVSDTDASRSVSA